METDSRNGMSHVSNHRISCELAGLVSLLSVSACILAIMNGTSESPYEITSGEDFKHLQNWQWRRFEHRISIVEKVLSSELVVEKKISSTDQYNTDQGLLNIRAMLALTTAVGFDNIRTTVILY